MAKVVKVIELLSESPKSWEDAVRRAMERHPSLFLRSKQREQDDIADRFRAGE
jgi:hypothetical protein